MFRKIDNDKINRQRNAGFETLERTGWANSYTPTIS